MEYHDKILSMTKYKPVNPTEVAKVLRKESFIASAMLSEMVQKGMLKISSLKVGSSPVYYDPAQPEQLMNYSSYLNEKDKKIYEVLKEKKILRENSLDPLSRVCVKNLKDFARPLEVSFANNKEIFWKWYLLSDSDAEPVIRQMLSNISQPQPIQSAPESVHAPIPQQQPEPQPTPPAPEPEPEPVPESQPIPPAPQPSSAVASVPNSVIKTDPEKIVVTKPKKIKKVQKKEEIQKRIVDKIKEMIVPASKPIKGASPFLDNLNKYFNKNEISIVEQMNLKRKSELEFIITINSLVGPLTYYCHAKDKKRVSEADLSNAFVQGQLLKLPVLFLITGNLTKGAEKISKDFKGVTVRNL
jgi:hypothetical protein